MTTSYDYTDKAIKVVIEGHPSDAELLDRIGHKDGEAFFELYQRYHSRLFTYLMRLVYERHAAEELLQDVFLAVWKGAKAFRWRSQVKTWIYRIAHNLAVSWLRRKKTLDRYTRLESFQGTINPEIQVESNLLKEAVLASVNRLPLEQREVVELAFYHDLSYKEIAEILGCPTGTVKSRMSNARRFLGGDFRRRGVVSETKD